MNFGLLLVGVGLLGGIGCGSSIGDACTTNLDCGTGRICDRSQPHGYCTKTPCLDTGCASEAVCVEFSNSESYCMLKCSHDGDCRTEYTCSLGQETSADAPFCLERDSTETL